MVWNFSKREFKDKTPFTLSIICEKIILLILEIILWIKISDMLNWKYEREFKLFKYTCNYNYINLLFYMHGTKFDWWKWNEINYIKLRYGNRISNQW